MKKWILLLFAAGLVCAWGCETQQPENGGATAAQSTPAARKMSAAEKKRRERRDPISDMLKIEHKESKPFITDSDILTDTEKKHFEESWSGLHRASESLHDENINRQNRQKSKRDSWVFF